MSQTVSVNGQNYILSEDSMRELVGWLRSHQQQYGDQTIREIQNVIPGDPRQLILENR